MADVWSFFIEANALVPEYPRWIFGGTIVIILALTQLVKLPIKHFTNKIKNENLRKKINILIMLLPYILGFIASGILIFFDFNFSWEASVFWGGSSQIIYSFLERVFSRIKKGETITDETISSDFKDSVDEVKTAEEEFNELVDKFKNGK